MNSSNLLQQLAYDLDNCGHSIEAKSLHETRLVKQFEGKQRNDVAKKQTKRDSKEKLEDRLGDGGNSDASKLVISEDLVFNKETCTRLNNLSRDLEANGHVKEAQYIRTTLAKHMG